MRYQVMRCPHCGRGNFLPFAMVCRHCGKDMAEPPVTESNGTSAPVADRHTKNTELSRIAKAVERNARATEGIFMLVLIMTVLTLLGLGVALYIVYEGIP